MKKRLLSILLLLCMTIGALSMAIPTAQAAETGVADKLNALKTKYPDGAYWNHYVSEVGQDCDSLPDWDETYADSVTSTACAHHGDGYSGNYVGFYDCNRFDGGSQCWGFARKIFFDVFGVKCSSLVPNYDSANVQVGDYVRFGDDNGGHSFIVIERTGNMITVVECNFGDAASSHCQIKWGRQFDITDTIWGLRFNYSYHAPNYDEINDSAAGPSQPDPTPTPTPIPTPTPSELTYEFDPITGVLTVSGHGDIKNGWYNECGVSRSDIKSVLIKDGVTSIGDYAFQGSKNLTSVTIPNSVTFIGKMAFWGCSELASIVIPNSVTSIGEDAFSNCFHLISITIPSSVTSIVDGSGLTSCARLMNITVDANNNNYASENGVLFDKRKTTLICYPSAKSNAAYNSDGNIISHYSIPDTVTSISDAAFGNAYNLTSVTIPRGVVRIGTWAFQSPQLSDIYYGGNENDWNTITINSANEILSKAVIHYNSTGPTNIKQVVQQLAQQALKNVLGVASIRCPVDVEISVNGQTVGKIENNVASGVDESKIYVHVENDEKYIYFLTSDKFTINLTATGTGTMEYSVQNLDVPSWTTLDEKYFRKVELTSGKKMVSDINYLDTNTELVDTPNVQLYVLGDDSNPIKKVLPDNKGTEVPLNTPVITFDTTIGSISIPPMAVGDDGTLSELPAPTRSGYTFNGWYMPDGAKVATNTVFTKDTTIKAKWTKNTVPSDPTTPSNPGYNPGGIYIPPTHSITAPSVIGGKISVNPTSAPSGKTVTVMVIPDAGYELAVLTVSDANGKILELTAKGNGQYLFKMPNGRVSINVEFRLVGTGATWDNPFVDVSTEDWFYDAVKFVSENGLMNGVGNNSFAPNMKLSRSMFAQILYNKEGQPSVMNSSAFNDVSSDAWYANAAMWATANGIVDGYGNGTFGPNDSITREQLAVMLWRYAGKPVPQNSILTFTDANQASDYALDALRWVVEQGIVKGKGNNILDPKGFASRAEAAQMLMNYLSK